MRFYLDSIDWIHSIVNENCTNVQSFFDVFSGTGSVASAFIDKKIVVCDLMKSNYYTALCWFSPENINREKLIALIEEYNSFNATFEDNYMSQNFSETYFNKQTCQKIGFVRDDIEKNLQRVLLIRENTPVLLHLYSMQWIG